MKIIRQKFPKHARMNYIGFHYYDGSDDDETVAWWWYGVWLWDSMWWCMGLPRQLRATTLGMAHTSVSVWWKAMKPAARQGTNWPFLGPPTNTNELFHSIDILLYSVLALCESCVHCVTYVIHPSIITLFTNPCQVQLMRRGSSKAKDSLRCESHLQKPKRRGVYALCSVLMWSKLLDWYCIKTLSRKKTRSSFKSGPLYYHWASINEVGYLQTLTQSVSKCGKQSLWSWSQSRLLPEQFAITRLYVMLICRSYWPTPSRSKPGHSPHPGSDKKLYGLIIV